MRTLNGRLAMVTVEGLLAQDAKQHFSRALKETLTTPRETLGVNFYPPPLCLWSLSECVGFRVSQLVADASRQIKTHLNSAQQQRFSRTPPDIRGQETTNKMVQQ